MNNEEYVIVPKRDIEKLEEARLALYEQFPNPDTVMLCRLFTVSQPMWKLANTKWPTFNNDNGVL